MTRVQHEPTKRELRLRIGRMRRRIDRRIRSVDRCGRELLSWRTYVRRYPGYGVMAAFGAGLALSAGLGRSGLRRSLGWRLASEAVRRLMGQIGREVRRAWETMYQPAGTSTGEESATTTSTGHGPA